MKLSSKGVLSGDNVIQKKSPHIGRKIDNDVWVNHWTAGGSASSSIKVLERRGLAAHIVLERDGTVFQCVPFGRRAAHAGKSSWRGRKHVSSFSIGNEICNFGPLVKDSRGNYRLPGRSGRLGSLIVPAEEADERVDLGPATNGSREFVAWERFTDLQIEATAEMIHLAHKMYDLKEVVVHSDISPGRKIDILNPGWTAFAQRFDAIVENAASNDTPEPETRPDLFVVKARSGLRLRGGPGRDFETIDTLPFNTEYL